MHGHTTLKLFSLFQRVAEYLVCRDLWVLINADNVPVIEKRLMLLRKLSPKTANYQAQDRLALHYWPLRAAPVHCKVQHYYPQRNHSHQFLLKADTLLSHH